MEWVKVSDDLPDHRKVLALPRKHRAAAMWLWLRGMCYSSRHLSDGFIPAGFIDSSDDERLADLLCGVSLWHPEQGGYAIHEYAGWNRTRDEVDAIKQARREAGRRGGKASGQARAKQTRSNCLPSASSKTNPEADTDTDLLLTKQVGARSNFPTCMESDVWKDSATGRKLSSAGHIRAAIESKWPMTPPDKIGLLATSLTSRCEGCDGSFVSQCTDRALDKIERAKSVNNVIGWLDDDDHPRG